MGSDQDGWAKALKKGFPLSGDESDFSESAASANSKTACSSRIEPAQTPARDAVKQHADHVDNLFHLCLLEDGGSF